MSMGFSINSIGGWQAPDSRPSARPPARTDGVPARRSEVERTGAARSLAAASTLLSDPLESTPGEAATQRVQRIRQLNPEQRLGMALYAGVDSAGGGAGRHLDLRV